MKEFKLLLVIFLGIFLSINFVLALDPMDGLDCSLEGTIKNIEFEKAGCFGEPGMMYCWEDSYKIDLKIEKVSTVDNYHTSETCEETYPLDSLRKIFIKKERMNSEEVFEINTKIRGLTYRGFGTYFTSSSLELVVETEEVQEETEEEPLAGMPIPKKSANNKVILFLSSIFILIIIILFIKFKLKRYNEEI